MYDVAIAEPGDAEAKVAAAIQVANETIEVVVDFKVQGLVH